MGSGETRKRSKNYSEDVNVPAPTTEEVDDFIPTPPDGGWGWVIVASSLVCNIIVDGIGYTFGIFLLEFVRFFNESKSKISLVGSLQVGTYLCAGPIVSALTNRFGCRPVCMTGSVIATIGFVLSTFSPSVDMLILTYGVIAGFGFGMMYLPAIVSVGFYFDRKRAIATGIGVCGSGVGMFIFAPLSQKLLDLFDWKNALLILAGIVFNGVVCGMLMRPLKASKKGKKNAKPRKRHSAGGQERESRQPLVTNGTGMSELKPDKTGIAILEEVRTTKKSGGAAYSSVPNIVVSSVHGDEKVEMRDAKKKPSAVDPNAPPSSFITVIDGSGPSNASELAIGDNKIRLLDVEDKISKEQTRRGPNLFISEANLHKMKVELARPLYRKDIFYSGSIMHIPQFRSQVDMKSYIRSVTSIHPSEMSVRDNTCFTCKWIPKSARDTLAEMLDISLLKNTTFLLICVGNILAMLGFYVPFVFLADRAIRLGVDDNKAAFLLSIIGITNTVGRVFAGFLADLRKVDSLIINNVAMVILGVSTMLAPFCQTYGLLCFFAAVFGLCVAAFISLTSIIICDLLGLENLTNAFGLLTLARGVSSISGPPLAGAVFEISQTYDPSFYLGGGLIVAGALCHCLLHTPCLRHKKPQTDNPTFYDIGIGSTEMDNKAKPETMQIPEIHVEAVNDSTESVN